MKIEIEILISFWFQHNLQLVDDLISFKDNLAKPEKNMETLFLYCK